MSPCLWSYGLFSVLLVWVVVGSVTTWLTLRRIWRLELMISKRARDQAGTLR